MSDQRLAWTASNGEPVSISLSLYGEPLLTAMQDLRRGLESIGLQPVLTERVETWEPVQ